MEFVRVSKAASRLSRGNRLNNKRFLKTRLPQAMVILNQDQSVKCRKFMRANFRAKLNCVFCAPHVCKNWTRRRHKPTTACLLPAQLHSWGPVCSSVGRRKETGPWERGIVAILNTFTWKPYWFPVSFGKYIINRYEQGNLYQLS